MIKRKPGPIPQDVTLRPKDGREVLFSVATGSYACNLQVESSDRDFIVFTMPKYTDLYDEMKYTKQTKFDNFDMQVYDVRRLPELLWKPNLAQLGMLASPDWRVNTKMDFIEGAEEFRLMDLPLFVRDMAPKLAKMNLPYLWDSCIGHATHELRHLKGNEENPLVEKHGYDTKKAMQAIRKLDFLDRFADSDFEDFSGSFMYTGQDRQDMLDIRNGAWTEDEAKQIIEKRMELVKAKWEPKYHGARPKEQIHKTLEKMVYESVRVYTLYELERDDIWNA